MATKKAAPKKKAPAKKTAAKKAPAKKAAGKKAPAKKPAAAKQNTAPLKEKLSKSQILNSLSDSTGLNRKQVSSVLDGLESLVQRSVKKNALGEFTLPGLLKIVTIKKPARPARKGVNPFTGEQTTFKAKPASIAVKVRPLKKLKEFAS